MTIAPQRATMAPMPLHPASDRQRQARHGALRSIVRAATLAALFGCAVPAAAVTEDADVVRFTSDATIDIDTLILQNLTSRGGGLSIDRLIMDIRLPQRPAGVPFGTPRPVAFNDIVDFSADLFVLLDIEGTVGRFGITPDNTTIEGINGGLKTDGVDLFVDAAGTPPGAPLFQITVDDPVDAFDGFPNGRRGEDGTDILLDALVAGSSGSVPDATIVLQGFSGSVNLGLAVLPDGFFGAPSLVATGQLTPENRFVIARAGAPVSAVPLPPAAILLISALGGLWAAGRTRPRQQAL